MKNASKPTNDAISDQSKTHPCRSQAISELMYNPFVVGIVSATVIEVAKVVATFIL